MLNKIVLSVIIPTLERPEIVFNLVQDLLNQSYEDFEIIIVDQSQAENRPLQDLSVGSADKIRYYFQPGQGGVCRSKNFALKKTKGEIILFLDDDTEVKDPDFIKYHLANYLDPEITGVGGRVADKNVKLRPKANAPILRVTKTGRVFANSDGQEKQEINAPRGGNVSYRKKAIDEIGGFDERFVGNAMREETDFSLRIFEKGHKIVFEPKAVVTHLGVNRGGSRAKKDRLGWYFDFFHNEMLFFLKHFPKKYLPFLICRKIRPIIACLFWYGRFRPRALMTPWRGFLAGYRHYKSRS
ncbi:MAG: glycosyltransferase [Patescibacteria group bacterium]